MAKASRDKGKRGEREARDMVRDLWCSPECVRSAQVSGTFAADLMGGPEGLHLEVKRYAKIAAMRWIEQATADARGDLVPTVLLREDNNQWCLMVPMGEAENFARRLIKHIDLQRQADQVSEVRSIARTGDEA